MSTSSQFMRTASPETLAIAGTLPAPIEILIADEWTLVREGIAALCNSITGFHVSSQVPTATAALAEIERTQPDLALIDLGLSDQMAIDVIRRVKERGIRTRCAVLATRKDRKTVLEVLRNGACGYLLKSSSVSQMTEGLHQFIQGGIYVSPQIEVSTLLGESSGNRHDRDSIESLSSREFQVFSMLVEGVRAKEIAARLQLSPKTVDTYRSSLMRKLDIHDVASLVKYAIQRDLATLSA